MQNEFDSFKYDSTFFLCSFVFAPVLCKIKQGLPAKVLPILPFEYI